MKVYSRLTKLAPRKDPVVALGVFDGLHRGHRHILQAAVAYARRIKGTSMVLTFFPHPQGEESIYSLPHRLCLFAELGVEVCIVVRFDRRFSRMSAGDFIEEVLAKKIRARHIYVGENFRFGRGARGNVAMLRQQAARCHFKVRAFKVLTCAGHPISSTLIRKLILAGKLHDARALLLRPVSVLGKVVRGSGLATRLGYPTANISPAHEIVPPSGIYCVQVETGTKRFKGVCYIGTKPTFRKRRAGGHSADTIEAHLFGFHGNLYGKTIEVQFLFKIRPQRAFPSPLALITQIKKDILRAKKYFSSH